MSARGLETTGAIRVISLVLSILISGAILGSVAIGLTWNAGLAMFA